MRKGVFWPTARLTVDPYTVLLMHMDGENNGTAFIEETGKIVTVVGNAVTSTSQSKFGGVSGYFPAPNGTHISIPDSTDFAFGDSDFTIDFWIYTVAYPGDQVVPFYKNRYNNQGSFACFILNPSRILRLAFFYGAGTYLENNFNTALSAATWYHVAFVRNGNTLSCYLNGVKETNVMNLTGKTHYNSDAPLYIGGMRYNNANWYTTNAYIDEFRISKGIARWTANFTPPTSPYAR